MTNFDKVKLDDIENNNCYIIVKYNDGWDGVSCFALPKFKRDAMYTEMEIDRKYTLEELGI